MSDLNLSFPETRMISLVAKNGIMERLSNQHEFGEDQGVDQGKAELYRVADVILSQNDRPVKGKQTQQQPNIDNRQR
jgi:hypothetical protein